MFIADAAPVFSESAWVTLLVAGLAALPGILGLYWSWRKGRRARDTAEDQVGLGFAKTAFINMEREVGRLSRMVEDFDTQKMLWDHDRRTWAADKGRLLTKIAELTEQLHVTNGYLQLMLTQMERAGVTPPTPPPGLGLRRIKPTDT